MRRFADRSGDAPRRAARQRSMAHRHSGDPRAALEDYRRRRRLVRSGQVLMAIGALVVVVHLLGHLGVFGAEPSGWQDLTVGYPAGAVLFLLGAVLAGQ